MIMTSKDLYQEINIIIHVLKLSGNTDFAETVENALSISTVPGEILGEIKIALEILSKSRISEQCNLQFQIQETLTYLNNIL